MIVAGQKSPSKFDILFFCVILSILILDFNLFKMGEIIIDEKSSEANLREVAWVKEQTSEELNELTNNVKESFYKQENDGNYTYDMELVKQYLGELQNKEWKDLIKKNTSAWIMAVQIALESLWKEDYDVGVIDGIYRKWWTTQSAIRKFQKDWNVAHSNDMIREDGVPGKGTIQKLLTALDSVPAAASVADPEVQPIDKAKFDELCQKEELNDDELRQIVKYANDFEGGWLTLNKVSNLTKAQAEILSGVKDTLDLDWLSSLDNGVALALASWSVNNLRLHGLNILDVNDAKALVSWSIVYLILDWLNSLGNGVASALVGWSVYYLYLNWLDSLNVNDANAFANWKCENINLEWLSKIDDNVVDELAKTKSWIEYQFNNNCLTQAQKAKLQWHLI